MLLAGDRVLIKKIRGFNILQELICWKTNSRFSHIEYILDYLGNSIDFRYPKSINSNIRVYFDGNWRVVLMRPNFEITPEWVETANLLAGVPYDVISYIGFIENKMIEDKRKINCAEGQLICDHIAGQFIKEQGRLISPQTYWDYMIAGKFDLVWSKDCPDYNDLKKLVEV
jgi:hypothetical protein